MSKQHEHLLELHSYTHVARVPAIAAVASTIMVSAALVAAAAAVLTMLGGAGAQQPASAAAAAASQWMVAGTGICKNAGGAPYDASNRPQVKPFMPPCYPGI